MPALGEINHNVLKRSKAGTNDYDLFSVNALDTMIYWYNDVFETYDILKVAVQPYSGLPNFGFLARA